MALKHTAAALRTFGGLMVSRLSQGLTENNSTASGELDSSISFRPTASGNRIGIDLSMLDYYIFVDEGRSPGKQPPTSTIEQWLTYPNVSDRFGSGGLGDTERKSLAFLIARKIGREGTDGNDFFTNVIESDLVKRDLPKIIERSVIEDTDDLLSDFFDTFT